MSPEIERPAPPYMQITDHYRRLIHDGSLGEGAKLPPVAEIAREWGVAHATAAKAIAQLQVEGLILTSPRGSFVAAEASKATTPRDRVYRLRRMGSETASNEHYEVTSASIVVPPAYVGELFGLEPGSRVVRREFVTLENGSRRALTVTWHAAELAEQIPELLSESPGDVGQMLARVESVTGRATRGRDFYHARGADQREASALGLPVGTAVLAGTWLLWVRSGGEDRLVEYGETVIPPRSTITYAYDIPWPTPVDVRLSAE